MTTKKINGHESSAARFLFDDHGNIRGLKSYSTIVVEVTEQGWAKVNGLYSRTTIKHIGWFARYIGTSYQTMKQIYNDNMMMNIYTGEVKAI